MPITPSPNPRPGTSLWLSNNTAVSTDLIRVYVTCCFRHLDCLDPEHSLPSTAGFFWCRRGHSTPDLALSPSTISNLSSTVSQLNSPSRWIPLGSEEVAWTLAKSSRPNPLGSEEVAWILAKPSRPNPNYELHTGGQYGPDLDVALTNTDQILQNSAVIL